MYQTSNEALPSAFITVNKSRRRVYSNSSVFLPDNTDFEIELFNPTRNRIGVEFSMNGTPLESLLILNPGQRVFLERYLTECKKFNFSTYNVEDVRKVQDAIVENGDVTIKFYREIAHGSIQRFDILQKYEYVENTRNPIWAGNYNSSACTFDVNNLSWDLCTTANTSGDLTNMSYSKGAFIETGRIEKGDYSNQPLVSIHADFEVCPFHIITYKIYPESRKSFVTHKDISTRTCRRCGKTIHNRNAKYCDLCGVKL